MVLGKREDQGSDRRLLALADVVEGEHASYCQVLKPVCDDRRRKVAVTLEKPRGSCSAEQLLDVPRVSSA